MVGMSVKGPYVRNTEEAEDLACQKAVMFAMEVGFSELVVEDNVTLMRAISDLSCHNSLLGHIYEDICCYLNGMQHASVSCIEGGRGIWWHIHWLGMQKILEYYLVIFLFWIC